MGISGSLIWSKTLMELIFNPCAEFRWSPEDLYVEVHGIFSDFSRSAQMLNREWGAESNGKLLDLFIPSKTATLVSEFAGEDLPLDRRNLGSCVCSRRPALGQHTLMMTMNSSCLFYYVDTKIWILISFCSKWLRYTCRFYTEGPCSCYKDLERSVSRLSSFCNGLINVWATVWNSNWRTRIFNLF